MCNEPNSQTYKLLVLRIVTWSYNCFERVVITYLKQLNYIQTDYYYQIEYNY